MPALRGTRARRRQFPIVFGDAVDRRNPAKAVGELSMRIDAALWKSGSCRTGSPEVAGRTSAVTEGGVSLAAAIIASYMCRGIGRAVGTI